MAAPILDETQYPETLRVTYDQRQLVRAGITDRPDGGQLWAGGGEMTFILKLHSNPVHKAWFKRVQDAGVSPVQESDSGSDYEPQPRTTGRVWSGGQLIKDYRHPEYRETNQGNQDNGCDDMSALYRKYSEGDL